MYNIYYINIIIEYDVIVIAKKLDKSDINIQLVINITGIEIILVCNIINILLKYN